MTGDRKNGFTLPNDRAIAQFAPNFTVYVLPPDVVCLYSEDRKFFLHGELYCALAAAIGKAERAPSAHARNGTSFPSDKIHEALKRLIERHYIMTASRNSTRPRRGLLGEPRPAARDGGEKSPEMPCPHSSDRRERREGA